MFLDNRLLLNNEIYYKFNTDKYKTLGKTRKEIKFGLVIISKNKYIVALHWSVNKYAPIVAFKSREDISLAKKIFKQHNCPIVYNNKLSECIYNKSYVNEYIPFSTWEDVGKLFIKLYGKLIKEEVDNHIKLMK